MIRIFVLLTASTTAVAQTIVPVGAKFPAPQGLIFQGYWKCSGNSEGGTLQVGRRTHHTWRQSRVLGSSWTEITETGQSLVGLYFVGYDRDKQEFVMIDADDPAYAVYTTDGWHDRELTLSSSNSLGQMFPRHRFVYQVVDPHQFTVTFQMEGGEEGAAWTTQSSCTCRKVGGKHTWH